jgi:DNA-binding transcriptional LysR family regulator
MDYDKCRVLVEVVRNGNIRQIAANLGYTPSGVSRMMTALERELGLTLLVRGRNGVTPTVECHTLLPYIKNAATAGKTCLEAAQNLTGLKTGEVRIGIAYPQFYPALTKALAAFRAQHPGVQITLREANTTPLVAALEAGDLDFALVSKRPGSFTWHPLLNDHLVALVPADHPLSHAHAYPLERFAQDDYIEIGPGEDTDNALAFTKFGIQPNVRYSVSLDSAGYQMVSAGLGVTLTNAIHAASHANQRKAVALPTKPQVDVSIGAAYAPDDRISTAARAFIADALPQLTMPQNSVAP